MAMVYSTAASTLVRASLSPPIAGAALQQQQQQQQPQQDAAEPRLSPPRRGPRQRWQWSKGDGPGEYGGPPLDFRIRKTWGEAIPDPITSSDGFIWNKDWQSHLPSLDEEPSITPPSSRKQPEAGFLSLNRSLALDSLETDLTKELVTPPKSVLALQVEALREGNPTDEATQQDKPRWRLAPTRREQKQWARARKKAGGMAMLISESEDGLSPARSKEPVKQDYAKLKGDLQTLTAIFGGAGLAVCYTSYSSEVALSYGVGLLGALAYIRMLGNSVDSMGQTNRQGAVSAAIGQPRLLVPVVLVMVFNRWNGVIAPEYNLLHLQLIPILVGFFTYKAATVVEKSAYVRRKLSN
ncbi:hypothetical protein GOP47_0030083 [Adiantum capillus-veneris]|nr:hypothetical protein GOP47_0030083 [Adiantum capillus-veneris]